MCAAHRPATRGVFANRAVRAARRDMANSQRHLNTLKPDGAPFALDFVGQFFERQAFEEGFFDVFPFFGEDAREDDFAADAACAFDVFFEGFEDG